MGFLPVLNRELRVRAHSPATYWGRLAVAGAGLLISVPALVRSGPFTGSSTTGRAAFEGLVNAAFLLCCASCLVTADVVSRERREGTLMLLLLTRVSHFDVLVGKLASGGLTCLLALIAFLPLLALPLLSGGVTGPEIARAALALANSLFLALSVGLWASSRGFARARTVRAALLTMLGLVLGPALLEFLFALLLTPTTHLFSASALSAVIQASAVRYQTSPVQYWLSLGLIQTFAWVFLLWALVCMRSRTGQAVEVSAYSSAGRAFLSKGAAEPPALLSKPEFIGCHYCGRQNLAEAVCCHECGTELHPRQPPVASLWTLSSAPSPLHWLLQRQRGLKPLLWIAALISALHLPLLLSARLFSPVALTLVVGRSGIFTLVAAIAASCLFAWVASRFFVEARRTGELELLVTTPVGAQELVLAHWDMLKRLLWLPVLVMLVPWLLQGLTTLTFAYRQSGLWPHYFVFVTLLNAANIALGVGACCWLALWLSSRGKTQARTLLWTVLLVNGLPYVLALVWSAVYRFVNVWMPGFSYGFSSWPWLLGSLFPHVATLLFYLWLMRLARWDLLHEIAGADPRSLRQILTQPLPGLAHALHRVRQWRTV